MSKREGELSLSFSSSLCEASAFCAASAVEYYYVCAPVGFWLEQPALNMPLVALRPEALAMLKLLLLQLMLKLEKYFMEMTG